MMSCLHQNIVVVHDGYGYAVAGICKDCDEQTLIETRDDGTAWRWYDGRWVECQAGDE